MPTTARHTATVLAGALFATCAIGAPPPAFGSASSSSPESPQHASKAQPVPADAVRRAGYEASRAFHKDPNSQETADAIRRLILTADGRSPAEQTKPDKKPPQRSPRQHHGGAQSDTVHDALSVARKAFGYAASHPNASQADLKAQADAMMSGTVRRELDGRNTTPSQPVAQSSKPARDYGEEDSGDGGH